MTFVCRLCLLLTLLSGCLASAAPPETHRIDAAIARAEKYLLAQQSPDGAFRSATYGFMKDGPSLTPHVLGVLASLPPNEASTTALARGRAYLIHLSQQDLSKAHLVFPVYTAADAMIVLNIDDPAAREAADRFRRYLLSHRLDEANGWKSTDLEFGGWGYALQPSKRPPSGQGRGPWDFSNLSATLYALRALHATTLPPRIAAEVEALLHRCQNFSMDHPDGRFDDGGFFFSPAEPLRNKAGEADVDRSGRTRFNSYGSMTADGALALLLCGGTEENARLGAALRWLDRHFSVAQNPGQFMAENEDLRNATYFYYCRSIAELFSEPPVGARLRNEGTRDWANGLAEALVERQRPDGAWVNPATDAREDDPLVSTPLALHALLDCRRVLVQNQ